MKKLLTLFFIINSLLSFSQDIILELNKISEEKFILDGVVSDQEIDEAKILEVIYEESPSFNTLPSQETIGFFTYSDKFLYVGVKAKRTKVIAPLTTRDNRAIWRGDFTGLAIDTYGDARNNIILNANPAVVKLRAKRLELEESPIHLGSDTNLRNILTTLEKEKPDLAIIDSIQTIWSDKVESAPGTVSQVRAAAHELTSFAKRSNTSIVLVGHVTKEGQIAGPRVVEHMVDTVLYFEGERGNQFRILRSVKNRFGPADEIGVFEMTGLGLQQVINPSELFLSSRGAPSAGSCVFAGIEGTRPLLVEIQALVSPTPLSQPRRSVIGWDSNRLAMILAVLEARCEIQFSGLDVYLNVAGGLKISEPAADLAVAAALISARENIIIPESYVFFGEVSLSGAIRSVGKMKNRLKEAEKLGFKQVEGPKNIQSVEDSNLEVFENLDLLSFVNKLVDDTKKQTLGT